MLVEFILFIIQNHENIRSLLMLKQESILLAQLQEND